MINFSTRIDKNKSLTISPAIPILIMVHESFPQMHLCCQRWIN